MWERACSRKRSVSHRMYRLNHRIREQSRSHMGFAALDRSHALRGNAARDAPRPEA